MPKKYYIKRSYVNRKKASSLCLISYYKDRGHKILHREGAPAITMPGTVFEKWYINNTLHRTDGPAVTYVNGRTEYWLKGKLIDESTYIFEYCIMKHQ